jgi:hypothetical protein
MEARIIPFQGLPKRKRRAIRATVMYIGLAASHPTRRRHEHPPFTTHQRTSPMAWLKRVHGTSWPSRADLVGAQA